MTRERRPRERALLRAGTVTALAILLAASATGCARVKFRRAMGRVQNRYVELFDHVEAGLAAESRSKALEVKEALQQPAVTESGWNEDAEFRRHHQEALEALDDFAEAPDELGSEGLQVLRSHVVVRCQTCHDSFRGK